MLQLKAVFARPAFMTLALWPVFAFACYSIYARIQSKYFAALLSVSGLDGDNSLVHQAFLYRNDIWLLAVLAPCLMALSFVVFRQRVVLLVWAVFIVFTQVLLYANLQSWGQVGRFLNWPALSAAVSFGLSKPEFVGEYIAIDGVLKLSALLLASCAVLYFGRAHATQAVADAVRRSAGHSFSPCIFCSGTLRPNIRHATGPHCW
jgi:hypothetical protein